VFHLGWNTVEQILHGPDNRLKELAASESFIVHAQLTNRKSGIGHVFKREKAYEFFSPLKHWMLSMNAFGL
jgi:hypothetical protein